MYKISEINSYIPILQDHQLYFIQRWGELLDKGNLNYRKLVRPCLRMVLKESMQVIEYYKNQALYEHNVFEIFEEVVEVLKSSNVLIHCFKKDWELVLERICNFNSDRNSFTDLKTELEKYRHLDLPYTLVKTLYNKLENEDIPKLYASYLKNELSESRLSFEIIDNILELLISELIYEGHHKQYLYNWGYRVFIKDSEPSFAKKIERISELGSKNRRNFECLIKLKLPDGYETLFKNREGKIIFYNYPDDLKANFGEQYSIQEKLEGEALEFFKPDKQIARIEMFATDEVSAINVARQELISTAKLFALENKHKQYEPSISEGIIFDPMRRYLNVKPYIESAQQGL